MTDNGQRDELHWGDARRALEASEYEAAAGHASAALLAAANMRAPLLSQISNQFLFASVTARGASDKAEAMRLLALYAVQSEEVSAIDTLLQDSRSERQIGLLDFLARWLLKRAEPGSRYQINALVNRFLADFANSGMSFEAADRAAHGCLINFLDIMLHRFQDVSELRATRYESNLALGRFGDAVKDLRLLDATLGPEPSDLRTFLDMSLCHILPHILHPESLAAAKRLVAQAARENLASLLKLYSPLVIMAAVDQAREVAALIARFRPEFALRDALHPLVDDLDRPAHAEFGRRPMGRRLIYANLVCWGRRYVDLLELASFASLLSANNLPALAEDNDIILEIVTNLEDAPALLASPRLKALSQMMMVRIMVIPDASRPHQNKLPYLVFGFASHSTLLRAQRDGADMLFLQPDLIYADGSFRSISMIVSNEKRAFFSDGLNANATATLAAIAHNRNETDGSLAISTTELCDAINNCLMPRSLVSFFDSESKESSAAPARTILQMADGARMHSFHKAPIYLSHASFRDIRSFNYTTPDGLMMSRVLDNLTWDQVVHFESANAFMVVEINDEAGEVPGSEEGDVIDILRNYFYRHRFSERLYWCFAKAVVYPLKPGPGRPLSRSGETKAYLRRVHRLFSTDSYFQEGADERDKARFVEFGTGTSRWRLESID